MSNNFIETFIKNQGPKLIEQAKSMSNQQLLDSFFGALNNPAIPQDIKSYLTSNKDKVSQALLELKKKF